jgi:hypothetical protein
MFCVLGFESVAIVTFEGSTHDSIFERSCVILFRFDDLAGKLYAFISLGREIIDVDATRMHQHAHSI